MKYLVKLVTPKNGIVLDPFAGSGTTLISAKLEDYSFIGIEMEPEYIKIARARLEAYK
jgi:DNA modification methylase